MKLTLVDLAVFTGIYLLSGPKGLGIALIVIPIAAIILTKIDE